MTAAVRAAAATAAKSLALNIEAQTAAAVAAVAEQNAKNLEAAAEAAAGEDTASEKAAADARTAADAAKADADAKAEAATAAQAALDSAPSDADVAELQAKADAAAAALVTANTAVETANADLQAKTDAAATAKTKATEAAATLKTAQDAATAAKTEADAKAKAEADLKAEAAELAASGPKFEWTINLGNTVKEDVPVTEVDENTVVVDKTGVSLVGVKNEDGSFTVADYFTTDDNGVVSVAGEPPAGRSGTRRFLERGVGRFGQLVEHPGDPGRCRRGRRRSCRWRVLPASPQLHRCHLVTPAGCGRRS